MDTSRIIGDTLPIRSPLHLLGWRLTSLRNRVVDLTWERRLGINTSGIVEVREHGAHRYGTFAYSSIFRILRALNLNAEDVFVDIGCGKGRVTCCAAMFPVRRVIGVDLDAGLCDIARENVRRMRVQHAPIEIVHAPAQQYDYSECTKFFLFNPFKGHILKEVLELIQQSLISNPRQVDVVYVNPAYEDVLEQTDGFERYAQWRWHPWGGLKADVSFWRNATRHRTHQAGSATLLQRLAAMMTAAGLESIPMC